MFHQKSSLFPLLRRLAENCCEGPQSALILSTSYAVVLGSGQGTWTRLPNQQESFTWEPFLNE